MLFQKAEVRQILLPQTNSFASFQEGLSTQRETKVVVIRRKWQKKYRFMCYPLKHLGAKKLNALQHFD